MKTRRRLEPGAGPVLGDVPDKPRQWTFMVYLAGDNNLESCAESDLLEMKKIGSSDELAIVAQVDRRSSGPTRRYYITAGPSLEGDDTGLNLSETNTGDPAELMRFMAWAMESYPAEHYALVLWNHGSGWKEDDLYQVIAQDKPHTDAVTVVKGLIGRARREGLDVLFRPSLKAILARGIAYDDTSGDFLDNSEMKRAIGCALAVASVDKLDLIGFDACLMSMIEVAYQLRDAAHYVVGSQENEPGAGWPYHAVLAALQARPTMSGAELAAIIVDRYMASYGPMENITQSALYVDKVQSVVAALDALCQVILSRQQEVDLIVYRAARRAQQFADPDYKDLYDLLSLIGEFAGEGSELKQRAADVMALLAPPGPESLVAVEAHRGYRMSRVHGVSIYFPQATLSPFYRRLDFSSESLWDDVLLRLVGV